MANLNSILVALELAYHGKFTINNRVRRLRKPYLMIWQVTMRVVMILIGVGLFLLLHSAIQKLTDFINYVIWGF